MDFNQVSYFLALADTLNFTRAAEQCHVSQPSLTQAIKRLENELGGELIYRDGRYTELTNLGKALRGHFEQINHTRNKVRNTAKAVTSGEVAELNIGLMCTIGPSILSNMLDSFKAENPLISIILHDVIPSSIPNLLLAGTLDGVFCANHGDHHKQLSYTPLFKESMGVAFPKDHELTNLQEIPLRRIAEYHYVDRLHCEFRQEVNDQFARQGIDLNVVFQSQREDWIQSMVKDGVGISCIPQYSIISSEIEFRPIIDPELIRQVEFSVATQKEIAPALNKLIKYAVQHPWPPQTTI